MHPNTRLYEMLRCAEVYFSANRNDCDIFWSTIEHIVDNFQLNFPCDEHKHEATAKVLRYCVVMRMRQHCLNEARNFVKLLHEQKKQSRLCAK